MEHIRSFSSKESGLVGQCPGLFIEGPESELDIFFQPILRLNLRPRNIDISIPSR